MFPANKIYCKFCSPTACKKIPKDLSSRSRKEKKLYQDLVGVMSGIYDICLFASFYGRYLVWSRFYLM